MFVLLHHFIVLLVLVTMAEDGMVHRSTFIDGGNLHEADDTFLRDHCNGAFAETRGRRYKRKLLVWAPEGDIL